MNLKIFCLIFLLIVILSFLFSGTVFCADIIENDSQGEVAFIEARTLLCRLGVIIDRNILLKVRPEEEVQVHHCSAGGRAIPIGGYYQPYDPETIWIVSGKTRIRTIADMVHELVHAWQSTNAPLQDRTIKEGFAMWCEYKALLMLGDREMATFLTTLKDPDYGDGLRLFLGIEQKGGIPAVLEYARTATKMDESR